ncbi:MAG: 50S ribosomal protein L20 [Patescibacteria group bacterium]|nr:50S ribosomal protein L20 [Patescibacteria group bacterium]
MRIKRGKTVNRKHKKVLKAAKGFRTLRRTNIKLARQAVLKAGQYAYRDRRVKKRDFRALWINRISAALAGLELKYSRFVEALKNKQVGLDRKILAQLATTHPEVFDRVVREVVK